MQTTFSPSSALPPTVRGSSAKSAEGEHLLGALFEELLNSALLTATSASIATWTMRHPQTARPRNLGCYLPPKPQLFPQTLLTFAISFDLSGSLRGYYDQLDFLRGLTLDYAEDASSRYAIDLGTLEMLSSAWQDLSATARNVANDIAAQLSSGVLDRHRDRFDKLLDILSKIEAGEHPCIDGDGTITVPFWAERRQLARRTVNLHAYLVVGQSIQRVAVINASLKGIGVTGLTGVVIGTVVQLLLSPGHSITGAVVWVDQDRAGISLEKTLPDTCSLKALVN